RHLALAGAVGLRPSAVIALDLAGTVLYLAGLHRAAGLFGDAIPIGGAPGPRGVAFATLTGWTILVVASPRLPCCSSASSSWWSDWRSRFAAATRRSSAGISPLYRESPFGPIGRGAVGCQVPGEELCAVNCSLLVSPSRSCSARRHRLWPGPGRATPMVITSRPSRIRRPRPDGSP